MNNSRKNEGTRWELRWTALGRRFMKCWISNHPQISVYISFIAQVSARNSSRETTMKRREEISWIIHCLRKLLLRYFDILLSWWGTIRIENRLVRVIFVNTSESNETLETRPNVFVEYFFYDLIGWQFKMKFRNLKFSCGTHSNMNVQILLTNIWVMFYELRIYAKLHTCSALLFWHEFEVFKYQISRSARLCLDISHMHMPIVSVRFG